MADVYEQNLPSKANLTVNDYIRVVGSDNNSYKQLVSDVAKKIIENYTGSSLAGSSQSVKSALDSLNSNMRYIYTGSTSFAAIDPYHTNDSKYLGGVLDAKVAAVISSLPAGMQMIHGINGGPAFGIILDKTNDANYAGIAFSYHTHYGGTPWYFSYTGSTYTLRPMSLVI